MEFLQILFLRETVRILSRCAVIILTYTSLCISMLFQAASKWRPQLLTCHLRIPSHFHRDLSVASVFSYWSPIQGSCLAFSGKAIVQPQTTPHLGEIFILVILSMKNIYFSCTCFVQLQKKGLQHNPTHVYSETSPTGFSGSYSQDTHFCTMNGKSFHSWNESYMKQGREPFVSVLSFCKEKLLLLMKWKLMIPHTDSF